MLCKYISRCAARITRHRAFSSGTLQLSILIFMFFKPVCEGALQTRVQQASSFAVDFPRFCEVKIMIFRYFRGSGQPVFSILRISENFSYFSDFGDLAAAKTYSLFAQKSRLGLTFRGLVLYCFWGARFFNFLWFGVPEDSISASFLALLWELWAFGKTAESVVRVVNFRGLTPSRRSLFAGLDCGWVSMMSFSDLLWFLAISGLPFWHF